MFKSGNSLALRLPKALGLEEGVEMVLREEQGRYIVEPVAKPKRKINLDGIWGIMPEAMPLTSEERAFDDPSRPWHMRSRWR